MLLWLAFTDDPDRSGSFVGKPMFHPYAKAQQEERNEAFAQSQGWQTWGAMISVMAYHEGCKDCIETFGMDVSQVPDEMWKQASSLTYDPDKALEFLNAKIRARSPSVDAWVPR